MQRTYLKLECTICGALLTIGHCSIFVGMTGSIVCHCCGQNCRYCVSLLLVELGLLCVTVVGKAGPIACHNCGQNWRYCVSSLLVELGLMYGIVVGMTGPIVCHCCRLNWR